MRISLVLALAAFPAFVGCSKHVVPSVEATIRRTDGVLVTYEPNKKVDIAELIPYMRRASWTSEWLLWKISTDVALADGKKVRFEQLTPMFRIEGIEGTFLIVDEDIAAYENQRARVLGR